MKKQAMLFGAVLLIGLAVSAPARADDPHATGGCSMHSRGMGMGMGMMHGMGAMRGAMHWTPAARGRGWVGPHAGILPGQPITLMLEQKEALGLTLEQAGRLETLRSRFQDTATAKLQEIGVRESDLHGALTSGTIDAGRAEAAIRALSAIQADLEVLRVRTIAQADTVLTAEQREKFRGVIAGAHCPGMGQTS